MIVGTSKRYKVLPFFNPATRLVLNFRRWRSPFLFLLFSSFFIVIIIKYLRTLFQQRIFTKLFTSQNKWKYGFFSKRLTFLKKETTAIPANNDWKRHYVGANKDSCSFLSKQTWTSTLSSPSLVQFAESGSVPLTRANVAVN